MNAITTARNLPRTLARTWAPGDAHYSAYVGPPALYDIMGASQFRLLTTLGLRDSHRLLDLGCGSLRAGRLFLPYLLPARYFGIEPNRWLIEDAVAQEIGADLIRIKRPSFDHNTDFDAGVFGVAFDFILAQSIFSHCGPDLIARALGKCAASLAPGGLILATFVHVGAMGINQPCTQPGWFYPECVAYKPDGILAMIAPAGLHGVKLPWFHPSQSWYAMALAPHYLPPPSQFAHLSGAVLRDQEFARSC